MTDHDASSISLTLDRNADQQWRVRLGLRSARAEVGVFMLITPEAARELATKLRLHAQSAELLVGPS